MKPERQRIAICEFCHWRLAPQQGSKPCYLLPNGTVADPLGDLNAMHEAEKILTHDQVDIMTTVLSSIMSEVSFNWQANAMQRAEAFLRTVNLWEEEPK